MTALALILGILVSFFLILIAFLFAVVLVIRYLQGHSEDSEDE